MNVRPTNVLVAEKQFPILQDSSPVRVRDSVREYVATLGKESREWLLALFVDKHMQLLSVETLARGGVSDVEVNFARIFLRGFSLHAHGFILVHNHPSGDPRPSRSDIELTKRLYQTSVDMKMRLFDHLIVADDEMMSVGLFAGLKPISAPVR